MADSTAVYTDIAFEDGLSDAHEQALSDRTEGCPDWFDESKSLLQKHKVGSLPFEVGDWFNQWIEQGRVLAEKHEAKTLQWDVGDWFARSPLPTDFPEAPKAYEIAEELLGIPRATLYDWASTALRIPVSVRSENLTWTHHRVVANGLPKADEATKKQWIDTAVAEKLSVKELRERLKSIQRPKVDSTRSFLVDLPQPLYSLVRNIARGRESTIRKVAGGLLKDYLELDEIKEMARIELKRAEERTYQKRRKAGLKTAELYDNLKLRQ